MGLPPITKIRRPTRDTQLESDVYSTDIGIFNGRLKFHNGTQIATILDDRNDAGGLGGDFINVQDLAYGAVGDGVTDDHDAFQAAIDDAILYRRKIFVPATADYYRIMSPLTIIGTHMPVIEGEAATIGDYNGTGSTINNAGCWGPLFYVRGDTPPPAIPSQTRLATGSGVALSWTADDNVFLDLSDAGASSMFQGLAQFSLQFFVRFTSFATDFQCPILESSGGPMNGVITTAFSIRHDATGHLIGSLNVGGSSTDMTAVGAMALNTTYQVTLDYDGTHVKLFYGLPGNTSVQAGSTVNVTGTVSHTVFETLSIGGRRQNWPHGDLVKPAPRGAIDSIRFSNVSRSQAAYTTPTTKYTSDANTLILENFDNETDDFSIITTSNGPAYLVKRGWVADQVQGLEFSHLGLASFGTGIHMVGCIGSYIHDCSVLNATYGIMGASDTFVSRFERLIVGGSRAWSRAGIVMNCPSGINSYLDIDYTGWPVGFISNNGGGVITSNYFHGGSAIYHAIVGYGSYTFESCAFSNEDATAGVFVADLLINSAHACVLTNCGMEHFVSSGAKALRVNGGHGITLVGCQFFPHASATQCVEIVNAPDQPVVLLNSTKTVGGSLVPLIPFSLSGWVRATPTTLNVLPVRASGFGTSSAFAGGTEAFTVNVGTGGVATNGVITMPPAVNGWMARVINLTAAAGHRTDQTTQIASTTTSITVENQVKSSGAAVAWTASDVLHITAVPY